MRVKNDIVGIPTPDLEKAFRLLAGLQRIGTRVFRRLMNNM